MEDLDALEIFKVTFESVAIGIAHVGADGKWIRANSYLCNLFGYSKDELFLKTFKDITYYEDLKMDLAHAKMLYDGTTDSFSIDKRYVKKDGTPIWTNLTASVVRDNNKTIKYFIAVIKDISIEKNREIEMLHINEKLQEIVETETAKRLEKERMLVHQSKLATMGEMLSNIAHQWRQPLNALALKVQDVVTAYDFNELNRDYLFNFKKSSMDLIIYMSQTIDDFRNFFRPEKEMSFFDVNESIDKAAAIVKDSLISSKIHLEFDFECFDEKAYGYPNEFAQVVLNILTNAKDAFANKESNNKRITITTRCLGSSVETYIQDNAGGISDDIIGKVFEPYFTTKYKAQGTGLGLYMSKMIIEQSMNGILSVKNHNDGALFQISLSYVR